MDELKKQIKEKKPAPLYVFHGEEAYLRDYYLNELKKSIVPEGTEAFNLTIFESRDFSVDGFSQALDAAPFMSECRMIIARGVDIFKGEHKDGLEKLFKEQWQDVTAVFVYDAGTYKPDARTKLYKVMSAFAAVVEFKQQDEKNLIPWIKRHFAALGKQIDTETAQYLIFLCGGGMMQLSGEIDKIAAYATVDEVKKRHVDAVGTPTTEAAAFGMTDAIAAGKYGEAIELLHKLIDNREEPVMLAGAIGKQTRGLYLARLAIDAGQGRDVVMRGMGYRHTFPADKLLRSAKNVTLEWCRRAVLACAAADSELKLGMDKTLTLERLILEMSVC